MKGHFDEDGQDERISESIDYGQEDRMQLLISHGNFADSCGAFKELNSKRIWRNC